MLVNKGFHNKQMVDKRMVAKSLIDQMNSLDSRMLAMPMVNSKQIERPKIKLLIRINIKRQETHHDS
jgi:hypothetical protein